jgi:hypothetical protein
MFANPDPESICRMLRQVRSIAVVGLSPKPHRPSYRIARALQRFGFRVIPVRPAQTEVLGERAYARLTDVPEPIDLVDVFRSPEYVDEIVDQCLAMGIARLWLQDGVVNEPAALRARAGGIQVVMDRCITRDYSALCA